MDCILVIVTALVWLSSVAYAFLKWKHSYWSRKGVPQLDPEFFYGNIRAMAKGDISLADHFLNHYKEFKKLGVKYGGLYSLIRPTFLPIDPELIKDIMQKNFDHFSSHFPVIKKPTIFTGGLFHQRDEPWRQARKKLTPTFTSGKMKMMYETMLEKASGLVAFAGEIAATGEPANIKEVLGRFTTDVIGSCGFGLECDSLNNPDSEFFRNGKMIFDPPEKKASFLDILIRLFNPSRNRKDMSSVEQFFRNVVTDTIDYREKNEVYRKDFLHLMIQLKNKGIITDDDQVFNKSDKVDGANRMDIDEIIAQCLLFWLAGYETSATTMTFALLEMAQNQEIQDKVRKEANEILKKYEGKMTYEAMIDLKYTERVVQETLRKWPPVSSIPRVCTKDYRIPGTDVVIEKETMIFIPALGLHRDPDYFPDPEKFDPERFNEENKKNIGDFTYMPFGEGPRMCLGLRFGMMQTKTGLAVLLRNYKFTLNEKTTIPLKTQRDSFITSVEGDVWLNIEKVN